MDNENIDKLKMIAFPNTCNGSEQTFYTKDEHISFQGIMRNGEMAAVQWIQVLKDGKLIAEIKESVCDLFYNIKS